MWLKIPRSAFWLAVLTGPQRSGLEPGLLHQEESSQRGTGKEAETAMGHHWAPFWKLGKCFDGVISVRDHPRASLKFYSLHKAGQTRLGRMEFTYSFCKHRRGSLRCQRGRQGVQRWRRHGRCLETPHWTRDWCLWLEDNGHFHLILTCGKFTLLRLVWSEALTLFQTVVERNPDGLSILRSMSGFSVTPAHLYHRKRGSKVGMLYSWKVRLLKKGDKGEMGAWGGQRTG